MFLDGWEISQNTVSWPNASVSVGMPTALYQCCYKIQISADLNLFVSWYASSQNVLKAENAAEWPSKKKKESKFTLNVEKFF